MIIKNATDASKANFNRLTDEERRQFIGSMTPEFGGLMKKILPQHYSDVIDAAVNATPEQVRVRRRANEKASIERNENKWGPTFADSLSQALSARNQ